MAAWVCVCNVCDGVAGEGWCAECERRGRVSAGHHICMRPPARSHCVGLLDVADALDVYGWCVCRRLRDWIRGYTCHCGGTLECTLPEAQRVVHTVRQMRTPDVAQCRCSACSQPWLVLASPFVLHALRSPLLGISDVPLPRGGAWPVDDVATLDDTDDGEEAS